jgi:hypothetical protein
MQRPRTAPASLPSAPAPNGALEPPLGQQLALAAPLRTRVEAVVAEDVDATQSLLGRVRARYVRLRQGAAGVVLGRDVELRQGGGLIVAGAELNMERSAGQWLIGGLVQARQVFAVAVIAGRVEGQVKCLLDARGAFAFGAGAALMTGLLRLLSRRKS